MSRFTSTLPMLVLASAFAATSAVAAQAVPRSADHSSQNATSQNEGTQNATGQNATTATQSGIKPGDPACLRETGSLIRAKPGRCLPVTGRSYTGDELRRTGTQNTARGLQMLDPSISVGH